MNNSSIIKRETFVLRYWSHGWRNTGFRWHDTIFLVTLPVVDCWNPRILSLAYMCRLLLLSTKVSVTSSVINLGYFHDFREYVSNVHCNSDAQPKQTRTSFNLCPNMEHKTFKWHSLTYTLIATYILLFRSLNREITDLKIL